MTITTAAKTRTFDVRAYRDGRWWGFEIPALTSPSPRGEGHRIVALGQARTVKEIDGEARYLAAAWLDVDEKEIAVTVTVELPQDAAALWADANAREAAAREAVTDAAKLRKTAVNELLTQGISKSDAARILGLSTQRISQLSR
jgi:hypothetical protein